jgi:hypothetical protein
MCRGFQPKFCGNFSCVPAVHYVLLDLITVMMFDLCDELITRPKESYRLWCVVVCDLQNLKNEEAVTRVGSQRHKKNFLMRTNDEAVGMCGVHYRRTSFLWLLRAGPRAARAKMTVNGAPNGLNYCIIFIVYT